MMKQSITSYLSLVFALLAILPINAQVTQTTAQYCFDSSKGGSTAINRLWQSPPNVPNIVKQGATYSDASFKDNLALYNEDTTTFQTFKTAVDGNTQSGAFFWRKFISQYSSSNIMAQTTPRSNFTDVRSSETSVTNLDISNDDHFATAMGAVATFPNLMTKVLQLNSNNAAGIYVVQFWIRGKPWDVYVDDTLYWQIPTAPVLFFSRANIANNVYWGPIVEKAWAKVQGSYAAYVGDQYDIAAGIKALSGVPTMRYTAPGTTVDQFWSLVSEGYRQTNVDGVDTTWRYIMAAIGSDGTEGAVNACGLRNQGGYIIMASFQVTYLGVVNDLLLMRDIKGQSAYNGDWNYQDSARWSTANKQLIPFGLDVELQEVYSRGIFVMPKEKFDGTCLQTAIIGYQRQDYVHNRYDAEWANATSAGLTGAYNPAIGTWSSNTINTLGDQNSITRWQGRFKIYIPQQMGDIYITLDTYPYNMVPQVCRTGNYKDRLLATQTSNYPVVYLGAFKQGQLSTSDDFTTSTVPSFGYKYYEATWNQPLIITQTGSAEYQAGATIELMVDINYINHMYPNQAKGFTISTYSRYALTVNNEFGNNFKQNMDGSSPTGFMNPPQAPQGDAPTGDQFAFGDVYTGATESNYVAPVVTPTTTSSSNSKISSTIAIKSLFDCIMQARDTKMFFELVDQNQWVIFIWFAIW